jgi:hypothetical protein
MGKALSGTTGGFASGEPAGNGEPSSGGLGVMWPWFGGIGGGKSCLGGPLVIDGSAALTANGPWTGNALSDTTGGSACEVLLWLATVIIVANTVQVFNARWVRLMLFDLHLGLSNLGREIALSYRRVRGEGLMGWASARESKPIRWQKRAEEAA